MADPVAENRRDPVGIIGSGDMGSAIAEALGAAGFRVVVFDIVPERTTAAAAAGAQTAPSADLLVKRCPVVLVVVDGQEAFARSADAILASAPSGTTVVVMTTVRPADVAEFAERARSSGVGVVDAAVNGGSERARRGRLTLMIGGEPADVAVAENVLETVARHLFRLGPAGAGMAAKLVNNVLGITSYAMLLEAMQLAAAYGMDEDVVTGFLSRSWGDSRHVHAWGRQDRRRAERVARDAQAYTRMSRDLLEAVSAAGAHDVPMPLTESAARILPGLLQARDTEPDRWRRGRPAPLCRVCGIELAAPFREAGLHPECEHEVAQETS